MHIDGSACGAALAPWRVWVHDARMTSWLTGELVHDTGAKTLVFQGGGEHFERQDAVDVSDVSASLTKDGWQRVGEPLVDGDVVTYGFEKQVAE